jgi:hypothetical protein
MKSPADWRGRGYRRRDAVDGAVATELGVLIPWEHQGMALVDPPPGASQDRIIRIQPIHNEARRGWPGNPFYTREVASVIRDRGSSAEPTVR